MSLAGMASLLPRTALSRPMLSSTLLTPSAALIRPSTIIAPAVISLSQVRTATKKTGGSTRNGRTSQPKYRGIKAGHGTLVKPGDIIVRQKGSKVHAAHNVGMGKDFTLHSLVHGRVHFHYDIARQRNYVSVDDGSLSSSVQFGAAAGLSPQEALAAWLPSEKMEKERLIAALDIERYLQLDGFGRYRYVLETIDEIKKKDEEALERTAPLRLLSKVRPFNLVDLTRL
ncbi:ribosomal L27 protein-domain-containing protein [Cladochytrium replicatum]|nr:ribosomal L27 protein-domain-containing protein [Cladochytrium replicatum]